MDIKQLLFDPSLFERFPNTRQGRIDFVQYCKDQNVACRNTVNKYWGKYQYQRSKAIEQYKLESIPDATLLQLVKNRGWTVVQGEK